MLLLKRVMIIVIINILKQRGVAGVQSEGGLEEKWRVLGSSPLFSWDRLQLRLRETAVRNKEGRTDDS